MRLASGGLVDRTHRIAFTFDGRQHLGHPGDTLASALIANGVRLVGRSFKYHRPRGIMTAGPEEPNALVELRTGARREPNTRATMIELYEGLEASSQNRWPSLRHDLMSLNGLLGPVLSAGFYYKTFMWPAHWWEKVYEPLIRRAAGLGHASCESDPDHYEKAHLHCDLLIIGAGPAGLMAALTAGRAGLRVVLAEEDFRLGGRLLSDRHLINALPALDWVRDAEEELAVLPEVRILRRTSVVATYDHGTFAAIERVGDHLTAPPSHEPRQRLWRIIAKQSVLAAGAIERPLVFANNDRPGVMLSGAVRTYLNRFAAIPGRRAVVVAACDDAVHTVDDLAKAGVDVVAVADLRAESGDALRAAAQAASAQFIHRASIRGVKGGTCVEAIDVAFEKETRRFPCDLVVVSGGWSPNVHLTCHLGGRPQWSEPIGAFVPGALPSGMRVAGAAQGAFTLREALAEGERAGREVAETLGFNYVRQDAPFAAPEEPPQAAHTTQFVGHRKAFVDFQNDVTAADIAQSHAEGFRAPEHMKRYTTLGMATDQGKTSNVNALAVLAASSGKTIAETGTTTFRPPVTPVAIGALAGHHRGKDFRPTRLAPTHGWAKEQGAVFVEAGAWLRAQWYPRGGESDWLESVVREVKAVRTAVGICDVSTLGKIDVQGLDAAAFLDAVYANTMSTLPIGRVRYGLMLREDGFVMDDGTVARLGETRFVVTTTTANAGRVLQHMEHAQQCLWPGLDVHLASVTDHWAQLAIAGPNSRSVLAALVDAGEEVSAAALPHLGVKSVRVLGGVAARLFRISYSGELGYEIAVPSRFGEALVRRIMEVGAAQGIMPYGTEALSVLRIEKGHVAGNEISGQTTARDLGLGKLVSARKDCIGWVMAQRPALLAADRPSLVGLKPVASADRLRAGAHLLPVGSEPVAANDRGYVTSVAYSPTLGHWIGLALLAGGLSNKGERMRAYDPVRNGDVLVEVTETVFYDPRGERLHD